MAADRIIEAMERQDLACTLFAMRSYARREGLWSEADHDPVFDARFQKLTARWRHD